ncbi:helix-turn-helix transcriptional regulator [Oricola sp.]|uniref:helix-turn-helix transcriptional regulator n=1 Tax=Oricola sp. TaxID=1979950 RepID=UPI0025D207E3|nr:helix-turn-helix transcriptional regulator [Oricola sp.]MCI5077163.1 helix-turn-helix transcriptional regulator [Oricola sp.]
MGLSIPARQVAKLHAVVRTLNDPAPLAEMRERLGYRLLDLFGADYFASFVYNDLAGTDDDAIAINMSADNIGAYQAYYQFHDPITSRMRRAGKAVHVNEVMAQPALERTEFFNDFLAVDGLTHGMNFHACLPRAQGGSHRGDLRIWRARKSGNFDRVDVQMLQIVGELFAERAMRAQERDKPAWLVDPRFVEQHRLTAREADVLSQLCRGKRDQDIARALGISPETVRSHLKALYQKTGCKGRTAVVSACMALLPENGDVGTS